ncbi:uncharacterized protein G2W53_010674 [Senna tora]|uniref:Uncharacterized protein n=1 Tax=Senna tora TaxID=362788 RepID=A0A835CBW7_9FABA|nr:uncharacterized protein G2W53_010674 [Senna tora]
MIRDIKGNRAHILCAICFQKKTDGLQQSKYSILIMISNEITQRLKFIRLVSENTENLPTNSRENFPMASEVGVNAGTSGIQACPSNTLAKLLSVAGANRHGGLVPPPCNPPKFDKSNLTSTSCQCFQL